MWLKRLYRLLPEAWRARLHRPHRAAPPPPVEDDQYVLKLHSALPAEVLKTKLDECAPWGHRIDFDNGVSTRDCTRRTPFTEFCLQKLGLVADHIPFRDLRGGRLLDVGCNSGYNSIHCASEYGLVPTGIDVTSRHVEVSTFLAELAGVDARFLQANAEQFLEPEAYAVVLHFGTLYHLPNPVLALKTAFENLAPGGWLGLETQVYDHPQDPNICYFMHMHNNDPTNFWALSSKVLSDLLGVLGFVEVTEVWRVRPPMLERPMARVVIVARKPG